MPLPESHQAFLRNHLKVHEELLDTLRSQQEELAHEIRVHELVLSLGRNERLLDVLGEIGEGSELAASACADMQAVFRERGVGLPDEFEVSAERRGDDVIVRGVYRHDAHPFELQWARESGFRARPLEPPGSVAA